jgi:photosystem II stability/assembly factor-like uncharacterized protein
MRILHIIALSRPLLALFFSAVLLMVPGAARGGLSVNIIDISPDQSTLDPSDPDGASGGRVNGLAADPMSPNNLYAASEWGGLFKSTDRGQTWIHLDGHVPTATWDVEVDPRNSNRVYAASFYDGRVASRAGINVSTDGGATWTHPATATPPANFCLADTRRTEPAAFGISIDRNNPTNVYIGTSCGLAISNDRGVTWRYVDPTPADPADSVWDVVVHGRGIIDVCGDDGHLRSTDGAITWTTATSRPLPSGRCSIAASPDEPYVLFAVVGTSIFETDNGGQSWPVTYANPRPQGRIPFIATNQRSGRTYDLWFGDVRLHRGTCTTPATPAPGGSQRCDAAAGWAGPFTRSQGAHDDSGDILFDVRTRIDACPVLFSSDGGVFRNTLFDSPQCHSPLWEQPTITPHALWNFDFAGVSQPGAADEDLYFGNQDNGSFGSRDGGSANPSWTNERCCDGFDVAADANRALNTICCFGGGRSTRLFVSSPGLGPPSPEINNYPPGNLLGFQQLDSIANFGPDDYVVITRQGVFVTGNIIATPITWTQLGAGSTPANACGVKVAVEAGTPTFFIKSGGCNGVRRGTLWRYQGTAPAGVWQQVTRAGAGRFGIYDVDPNDPDRIFASDLGGPGDPEMVITSDGGTTWNNMPALDSLMTGGGVFQYQNRTGPTRFTGFNGYPQPTLASFDPADGDILVAGGADSGVFLSADGGASWDLITDPIDPGTSGTPHIPRPRYAHFDHDAPGDSINLYLGTQGRGAWRLTFEKAVPKVAFQYAAKIVCGIQKDPEDMRLARGFYATTINIHNPLYEDVIFAKKLALTFPPKEQLPGKVIPIAKDKLGPDEALKVDCVDIRNRLFPNGFPAPYIEGFVVIQSPASLDVTAVYTTASLDSRGRVAEHSSIDIEQIPERVLGERKPPPRDGKCPDLVIRDIQPPAESCPSGADSCVTKVAFTVANVGDASSGQFDVKVQFSDRTVTLPNAVPGGLAAGDEQVLSAATTPGRSCFRTDCTICVTVDSGNDVEECNEENNKMCETTLG